jgi:hypothetical protein
MKTLPMRAALIALLAATLLPACSSRAWYEGMRASAENECRKLPPGGYEDCMARVNRQSYEDYERERQRR